jgi:hypothetical protein
MENLLSDFRYQVGGSLPIDFPAYVSRRADQELFDLLRRGEFSFVFNCRQMGKSSLRVRVMRRLKEEGCLCALIDPQTLGKDLSNVQWYAGIIRRLVSEFNLHKEFSFPEWWQEQAKVTQSPEQYFYHFIEDELLRRTSKPLVIFVEEVDTLLSYNFDTDGFFSLIRSFHENRADQFAYRRLTFAFLGVTTPIGLIRAKDPNAFNIGQTIELSGFEEGEAKPLLAGLTGRVQYPEETLRAVLKWSGGQPFLTQKLLALIHDHPQKGETTDKWIDNLIQKHIIEGWESQDEPPHFRSIRERLKACLEQDRNGMYSICQQLLENKSISQDQIPSSLPLRLTGFINVHQGHLRIANPIYSKIFNVEWLNHLVEELRPPVYAKALKKWREAPQSSRHLYLIKGRDLQDARAWANEKNPSSIDLKFLAESREGELQFLVRVLLIVFFAGSFIVLLFLFGLDNMGDRNTILESRVQNMSSQISTLTREKSDAIYTIELTKKQLSATEEADAKAELEKRSYISKMQAESDALSALAQELSSIERSFTERVQKELDATDKSLIEIKQKIDLIANDLYSQNKNQDRGGDRP